MPLPFGIVNPVSFVNPDFQGLSFFLDFVSIFRESTSVDIIDLGDGSKGNELDDHINGCIDGAQVDDAGHLGCETTHSLHEGNKEGAPWIREVKWLVCHILHHTESLTHIRLNLQVH